LQLQTLNRAAIRATRWVAAGVNSRHLYRPHPAAIKRALPRRVTAARSNDARLRVFVDALEVSDDLELRPEDIRKKSRFGTGRGVPGSATGGGGQASVPLAAVGVADQKCSVSSRYGNGV